MNIFFNQILNLHSEHSYSFRVLKGSKCRKWTFLIFVENNDRAVMKNFNFHLFVFLDHLSVSKNARVK